MPESKEQVAARNKAYRESHREEIAARRKANHTRDLARVKVYRQELHQVALQIIAVANDYEQPECMMHETPQLRSANLPCAGPLQVDHRNGGKNGK